MRIMIDESKCSGYASCELAAPEIFRLGSKGVVELLDSQPVEALRAKLDQAVRSCPTRAISIVDL